MYPTKQERIEAINAYRMKKSPKAPFTVCTNAMRDELVEKLPKTKAELLKLKGWKDGGARMEKYGQDFLDLLWKSSTYDATANVFKK